MSMHRYARLVVLVFAISTPLACGRGDAIDNRSSVTPPKGTQTSEGPPVGEIINVLEPVINVNDKPVGGGQKFPAGSILRTTGVANFKVGQKFDDCSMFPGAEVRVHPDSELALFFEKGDILCKTPVDTQKRMTLSSKHAALDVRDPIFGVEVQADQTIVRVVEGFVQVRGRAEGGPARLVGPDQQVVVRDGSPPGDIEPFDPQTLPPAEQQAVAGMRAALPDPPVGLPDPSGSPALTRIGEVKTLRLAVDSAADERSSRFIQSLFDFIGQHWAVKIDTSSMPARAATAALKSGQVDVFVPPVPLGGARSIPFFADELKRAWLLNVDNTETKFESVLRDFLFSTLNVGEYGRRYADAFARPPDYEVLRPVVFADEAAASEPASTTTTTASQVTSTTKATPTTRSSSGSKPAPPPAPETTTTTERQPQTAPSPPPTTSSTTTTTTGSSSSVQLDCNLTINQSKDQC